MAMLTIPTLSRRQFGAAAIPFGVSLLRAAAPAARWALLSDTHIPADPENVYRGFRPVENLKKVTPAIQAWKPDAALICGDLVRLLGLPEDYAALRTLLSPVTDSAPVAYTLGNHDNRKNFLAAFGKQSGAQAVPNRHVLVVETGPVRCIVLDSLIETNQTPGFLGKAQRTWLGQYLESASDMPTLVFVHHPPDDNDSSLHDAPRLFDLLRPQRKVKAIVFGHSHRYSFDTSEGLHLINLPALGYNFNDSEPIGWVESVLSREGGDFTLRACGGNLARNGKTVSLQWRT